MHLTQGQGAVLGSEIALVELPDVGLLRDELHFEQSVGSAFIFLGSGSARSPLQKSQSASPNGR
jgi:hypothetical protein